jgi:hypothetical protein
MHWTISYSFFLVRVSLFDKLGELTAATPGVSYDDNTPTIPDYSQKAMLATIVTGTIMILVLIGNVFRRYGAAMRLAGNNS